MNAVTNGAMVAQASTNMTATEMRAQVNLIQEVMQAVMIGPSRQNKDGVHYGIIPGTPKPTLYKAGAEKLAQTFRIAASYIVDELSTDDHVRYRITCVGTHQATGLTLGAGLGECSTGEEKYKWKRTYSDTEFHATPENRRRMKWFSKKGGEDYSIMQIRTERADLANTVLKMACKRALVAMILTVTAASDIFTQDIEDLPEDLRGEHNDSAPTKKEGLQPYPDDKFKENLPKWLKLISDGTRTAGDIITMLVTKATLTEDQKKKIRATPQQPAAEPDMIGEVADPAQPTITIEK